MKAAGASLVSIRKTSTKLWSDPEQIRCPLHPDWYWVSEETGATRAWRCGRNSCNVCVPVNAWKIVGAVTIAKPYAMFTATQVGDTWAEVRRNMNRLNEYLKREGVRGNFWEWHVEPNPKGTGNHAHGTQYGTRIPQSVLSECAARAGMGRVVDIRKLKYEAGFGYGVKLLSGVGYGMKQSQRGETMGRFLELNGGRIVHTSRGFWRDGATGERFKTRRQAERRFFERKFGISDEKWVLVRGLAG